MIVEHCSFEHVRQNGSRIIPGVVTFVHRDAPSFIDKGTNRRWRDALTVQDVSRYEQEARARLGEACAAWLADGRRMLAQHQAREAQPVRSQCHRTGREIITMNSAPRSRRPRALALPPS